MLPLKSHFQIRPVVDMAATGKGVVGRNGLAAFGNAQVRIELVAPPKGVQILVAERNSGPEICGITDAGTQAFRGGGRNLDSHGHPVVLSFILVRPYVHRGESVRVDEIQLGLINLGIGVGLARA